MQCSSPAPGEGEGWVGGKEREEGGSGMGGKLRLWQVDAAERPEKLLCQSCDNKERHHMKRQ